jgi:ribonuclease T2
MRRPLVRTAVVALAVALTAWPVIAQREDYRERRYERDDNDRSDRYERRDRHRRDHRAGEFDYYVMSLSWSPSFCAERQSDRYEAQCDLRSGRPYAFVVHGLWPQYEKGWPQFCRGRHWVPGPVADRMLDIMPSKKLIFNEYRKHGTCSGLGIDGYFDLVRQVYGKVKIPDRFVNVTDDRMMISPQEVMDDFMAANPDLKPDMIAVRCGGSGHRLREVRICFDKSGNFRSCGHNENQHRLCSADRMYVPPVRGGPR